MSGELTVFGLILFGVATVIIAIIGCVEHPTWWFGVKTKRIRRLEEQLNELRTQVSLHEFGHVDRLHLLQYKAELGALLEHLGLEIHRDTLSVRKKAKPRV